MPVSWVLPGPHSGITCTDTVGTLWNGGCTGLAFQQQPVGDVSWEIHAARLLAGKLNADVVLTRSAGTAQGNLEIGFDKHITARNIKADLPLDRDLTAAFPPDVQGLRGRIHAQLAQARIEGRALRFIQGVVEAHDLM